MGGSSDYFPNSKPRNIFAERDARERDERLQHAHKIARASADNEALRTLAEIQFPADFQETAKRWGLETFMREVWVQAYQKAWRDAHLRMVIGQPEVDGDSLQKAGGA